MKTARIIELWFLLALLLCGFLIGDLIWKMVH